MSAMNPFAKLPSSVRRSSVARSVKFKDPRLGAAVMVAAPGSAAVAEFAGTDIVKRLRSPKEPLPTADNVDPSHVLRPHARSSRAAVPGGRVTAPTPPSGQITTFDSGVIGNPTTIPPDTAGVVNGDTVFAPHNNRIWIQGRNGETVGDMTLDAFWNVFGHPVDTFDPKVVHDPHTQRLIFVTCANAERADSSVLVAVSDGDDPSGLWQFGEITVDQQTMGEIWFDYPSLGFTADKITISLNLFTLQGNQFRGVAVFVIDKAAFLNPPNQFTFDQFIMDDQGGTHAPALVHDPDTEDQFLLTSWTGNFQGNGFLALFRLTGSVAAGTTDLQRVGFLEVGNTWREFLPFDFAPQKGTETRINIGDNRIQWVVHRHGRLYAVHTVFVPADGPTRSAIQWHEIEIGGTPAIVEHGLIEDPPAGIFCAFPSLAVNAQRDVLIGMAAFSNSMFGSGAYSVRLGDDGAFGPPQIFAPGENTYELTFGGGRNRWGDYSATMVDPVNDHDFWTIQEYAGAEANTWRTRWARVALSPPLVG